MSMCPVSVGQLYLKNSSAKISLFLCVAKLEAEADTSDTPKRTCLTCLTCLEVKNYYREGQNPFDYGGPGTQILDALEFPVRKEGESKMECLWRFPRFF